MPVALQGPSGWIALETPSLTVGRAPDNQLIPGDNKVSSHHAIFQQQGRTYSITDLGSSNGTFVNDVQLTAHVPVTLKHQDRIRVGDTLYTYEETQPAPAYTPTVLGSSPSYEGTQLATPPTPVPGYDPLTPPPPPASSYTPVPTPYAMPGYTSGAALPSYTSAAPAPKKGAGKIVIIVLVIVLILAGAGGFAGFYLANRPQPAISLSSTYQENGLPAGALNTTFNVSGEKFSTNSAITFLLDNTPLTLSTPVQSDSKGNVKITLKVLDGWTVGTHTLTARDASGYTTQTAQKIAIVQPGEAKTPGPHNAPTDSASGTLIASITSSDGDAAITLNVKDGKVCTDNDDGQPHKTNGTSSGIAYTETIVSTCSGTYKGGKITYTRTNTRDEIDFDNGLVCVAHVPYTSAHLEGTFSDATTVSGTYTSDALNADCNMGVGTTSSPAGQGTWTGVAVMA